MFAPFQLDAWNTRSFPFRNPPYFQVVFCLLFILGELLSQFFKHTKLPWHFGSSKPTGAKRQTDKTKPLHEQNLEASDATEEFEQFL